jgi:hypothetical protein
MRNLTIILLIAAFLFLQGFGAFAIAGGCCSVKAKCDCASGTCCVKGECKCSGGTCCTADQCKCATVGACKGCKCS